MKWEYPKDKKREIYKVKKSLVKRPWKYLHNQFQKRTIHEWRSLLETCLENVLSNKFIGYSSCEILNFINSLLVLQTIEEYEPEIN